MRHQTITILGIESSCDDTGAAVLRNNKILANVIANQEIHRLYGGVVPELASRAHQQNIVPVVDIALKKVGIQKEEIDAVAFTRGPGLMGSLLVGSSFAKAFALALDIPLIEVNHMQAHVLAHFIEDSAALGNEKPNDKQPFPSFPFLCLTVSGGHTQIVCVRDYLEMKVIGETTDDAAGEAFDKAAKIIGLPYPGGPLIDKFAQQGNPLKFSFPHPNVPEFDFSFSGLKTAFLYFINEQKEKEPDFIEKNKADICASIQYTIVEILLEKLYKASLKTGIKEIAVAGGVSANFLLRKRLKELSQEYRWNIFIPKFEYCTDNAAMIAIAGYYKFLQHQFTDQSITPLARMKL